MIDDKELRGLFRIESDEHLQSLESGLLGLEANPKDDELLQQVFRNAHSLKGSARMLGVEKVERVAHRFEDVLGSARRGELALSAPIVSKLYETLDAMRSLVEEAVEDVTSPFDVEQLLAELASLESGSVEPPKTEAQAEPTPTALESSVVAGTASVPARTRTDAPETTESTRPQAAFAVETIRVDARKLDDLMFRAGELVVTRGRIDQRVQDVGALKARCEDWRRTVEALRHETRSADGFSAHFEDALQEVERFADALLGEVGDLHEGLEQDRVRLNAVVSRLEEGIRSASLVPLATVFNLFPRTVRDMRLSLGKEVELRIEGEETTIDKAAIEQLKDPLMHILRNSVDHGIEMPDEREANGKPRTGTVWLRGFQSGSNIVIEVADDGKGIDVEAVGRKAVERGLIPATRLAEMSDEDVYELLFLPGFSTKSVITDLSGRGVGMDVVKRAVENLRGTIRVESSPGRGSRFRVTLPMTLATTRVLVVVVAGTYVAVPLDAVHRVRLVSDSDLSRIEPYDVIQLDGEPVPVVPFDRMLELPDDSPSVKPSGKRPVVVVRHDDQIFGGFVDAILGLREVLIAKSDTILRRVRNVTGTTILSTGDICFVLDPGDLLATLRSRHFELAQQERKSEALQPPSKPVVLLAEDSIATRVQMTRVLELAGYDVIAAVDGLDAYAKLVANRVDALVTDVEMPNLDGFALTAKVRSESRYEDLPVVLVTSLSSDEHRKRGAEAGANAYITKAAFDQRELLDTLERLI